VRRGLEVLRVDEASTLPFLLELLGVKDSGFDPRSLSPEGKKDRTIQAIARLVLKGAEIRPLILVVEDLHWMDESSEDVLKDLLEHIAGARVLLLFTYRPEYVHTWGQRSYHHHVHLNRLSGRESLEMVTHLLGTEHLAENLADLIQEKAEGVPFFIEEFVKSLQDLRIIERQDHTWSLARDPTDVTIPSTIQDVLMARVDALPVGAKEVLQVGSVIEREFPHALLERVTGLPERDLLSRLSALKDAELLYERGVYPQSSYIFKHALTRGVLYDSILTQRRRELHEAVGTATEALYAEELQDHAAILCEHFAAAGNHAKAADYARRAGRQAERAGAFAAAVAYGERRVLCLEKLPRTEETQRAAIEASAGCRENGCIREGALAVALRGWNLRVLVRRGLRAWAGSLRGSVAAGGSSERHPVVVVRPLWVLCSTVGLLSIRGSPATFAAGSRNQPGSAEPQRHCNYEGGN
jgi:predicted ATPase